MKIQCENCGTQHELDPPSWVVSSGRAFRFRCSSCGHSQSVQPNAIPNAGEEREVEPTTMGDAATPPASPEVSPPGAASEPEDAADEGVFLKQNGQIYMVRDWDTLKRWIHERRVDRHDLVSEGGVRWEPVGSRADLMAAFSSGLPDLPTTEPTPFPFGGSETPFGKGSSPHMGWHDDDTEGVPTGLPPLPTEEHRRGDLPSIPPPALIDEDDTPFTAPRALERTHDPSRGAVNPTIAPPATLDDDDDYEEPSADSEPNAEHIATAPGSVMRFKEPSNPPPELGVPSPSGPSGPASNGDWDDLMVTEPSTDARDQAAQAPQKLDFDDEWNAVQQPANHNALYAIATLIVGTVSIGLLYWAFNPTQTTAQPAPALPPPTMPAAPMPAPVAPTPAAPVPAAPTPADPVPAAPAPAAPAPAPETPAPTPAAPVPVAQPAPVPPRPAPPTPAPAAPKPAPAPTNVAASLEAGWTAADADPTKASQAFKAAIDASPGNAEAYYGYGYVMLKLERNDEAARYLCLARSKNPAPDVRQDVEGMLANHQLSCP